MQGCNFSNTVSHKKSGPKVENYRKESTVGDDDTYLEEAYRITVLSGTKMRFCEVEHGGYLSKTTHFKLSLSKFRHLAEHHSNTTLVCYRP